MEASDFLVEAGRAYPLGVGRGMRRASLVLLRRDRYDLTKRAIDIIGALVGLIALVLILPIIAIAVQIESPGPIFFRQPRCGQRGRMFDCLKFRTMVPDAEARLTGNVDLYSLFKSEYKLQHDPRVTRVGAIMRRTSIDELPQFWNVLVGDMSLVGPRPVVADELRSHYAESAATVLSVRPGLTGLWQVSGRSDLSYPARIALDLDYIRRRSVGLDLVLMLRTPAALTRGAR